MWPLSWLGLAGKRMQVFAENLLGGLPLEKIRDLLDFIIVPRDDQVCMIWQNRTGKNLDASLVD
jgi:hypothetical protein